jgi:hypothetical protein
VRSHGERTWITILLLLLLWLAAPARAQDTPFVPAQSIGANLQEHHAVLLDVREDEEIRESGTLPNAIQIPYWAAGIAPERVAEGPRSAGFWPPPIPASTPS